MVIEVKGLITQSIFRSKNVSLSWLIVILRATTTHTWQMFWKKITTLSSVEAAFIRSCKKLGYLHTSRSVEKEPSIVHAKEEAVAVSWCSLMPANTTG